MEILRMTVLGTRREIVSGFRGTFPLPGALVTGRHCPEPVIEMGATVAQPGQAMQLLSASLRLMVAWSSPHLDFAV
jgi:hypothetical protein